MPGIDPGTSRMQSERSTIELHSPDINTLNFIVFQRLTHTQHYEQKEQRKRGDAGHRSRYLSHAMRALYPLSYIDPPDINTLNFIVFQQIAHTHSITNKRNKENVEMLGIDPSTSRMQSERSTI